MIAKIMFEVYTDYIQTGFNELATLGRYEWIKSRCMWTFPLDKAKEVEALLGVPIEFKETDLERVQERTPQPREDVDVPEFKGKSGYVVEERPTIYVVHEWRKVEKEDGRIKVEGLKHEVPFENVNAVRTALERIDERRFKNHRIPTRRLAEEICKVLGVTRFNRPTSNTFDFEKMFGCRGELMKLVYYPLKVLASPQLREVVHHKSGHITKLQEYLKYDGSQSG